MGWASYKNGVLLSAASGKFEGNGVRNGVRYRFPLGEEAVGFRDG
jgi:hypothetical protein